MLKKIYKKTFSNCSIQLRYYNSEPFCFLTNFVLLRREQIEIPYLLTVLFSIPLINYFGIAKGKWETYLITPDQKILKNPGDLKLYIAKSGSIVDSNLVNFSLPKRTAKVDKMLSNSQKKKLATKPEMEIDDDIAISASGSSPQKAKSSPQKAKNDENMELDHSRFSTEGKISQQF